MAAISLFGNNTFFDIGTAAWNESLSMDTNSILSYGKLCTIVPFSRLGLIYGGVDGTPLQEQKFPDCSISSMAYPDRKNLTEHLAEWLHGFNDTAMATRAVSTAVFLANRAGLTMDKWSTLYDTGGSLRDDTGREIYAGSGTTVHRPHISVAAIVIITCILFLELLSLGGLAWLIYRGLSETRTLDVMAFTRLKDCIEE